MSFITIEVEDEQGRRREALVSSSAPPQFGEWFDDDGEQVMRVPSAPRPLVKPSVEGVTAYSLPRKQDVIASERAAEAHYRKHGVRPPAFNRAPRYDSRGFAVLNSRREVSEYQAAHNSNPAQRNSIDWDPDGNE